MRYLRRGLLFGFSLISFACGSPDSANDEGAGSPSTSPEASDDPAEGDVGMPTTSMGPGLCSIVDVAAVEAVLGVPLQAEVDAESRCRLGADGPESFVLQRALTNGATIYENQFELLGSDEEIVDLGDRAFRSGAFYAVQIGDQYVGVAFAATRATDADARFAIVVDLVAALGA